jgi:pyruvate ferredoxin oxidoreductase beta subunit
VDGPAFVHAIAPCTRGWRYPTNKTIEVSRLAVQTCAFPLYECRFEEGRPVYELSGPSMAIARRPEMKKPVEEYLNIQGRYRHLFRPERRDDLLDSIQAAVDLRWEILLEKARV